MLRNDSKLTSETDETCIFCLIANGQDKETQVIKKNKELVCFRDIYPAAPHHYLVVPIQHIHSCFSLHRGHVDLVKRMAEMGKAVLQDQGITNMEDISLGFHQPPCTSVDHLHLHVLAPRSQIYEHLMYKFIPKTDNFVTEESLLNRIKDKAPIVKEEWSGLYKLSRLIRDRVAEVAVPAESPKLSFPWPHQPALTGGSQGAPRPAKRYNPSAWS